MRELLEEKDEGLTAFKEMEAAALRLQEDIIKRCAERDNLLERMSELEVCHSRSLFPHHLQKKSPTNIQCSPHLYQRRLTFLGHSLHFVDMRYLHADGGLLVLNVACRSSCKKQACAQAFVGCLAVVCRRRWQR